MPIIPFVATWALAGFGFTMGTIIARDFDQTVTNTVNKAGNWLADKREAHLERKAAMATPIHAVP